MRAETNVLLGYFAFIASALADKNKLSVMEPVWICKPTPNTAVHAPSLAPTISFAPRGLANTVVLLD